MGGVGDFEVPSNETLEVSWGSLKRAWAMAEEAGKTGMGGVGDSKDPSNETLEVSWGSLKRAWAMAEEAGKTGMWVGMF
jgi:hypothetical protein